MAEAAAIVRTAAQRSNLGQVRGPADPLARELLAVHTRPLVDLLSRQLLAER